MTDPAQVLLSPVAAGDLHAKNRVWMAPLTRNRSSQPGDIPNAVMAEYYRQRASAGLIIAEATQISQQGKGYYAAPGVYTDEQVEGWKLTTDAVHAEGGLIVLQLWHVGRVSHKDLQPGNQPPVSASAIPGNHRTYTSASMERVPTTPPRALETDEIPGVVADYAHAARCAKDAGFDGVEIHGANGYLIEQFMRAGTNRRTDAYGGGIDNRIRFALEVTDAVLSVWPASRVGYRISPTTGVDDDRHDPDPVELYARLSEQLGERGLAFLHGVESWQPDRDERTERAIDACREAFGGVYVTNGGLTPETAADRIAAGKAHTAAFGKLYISNPDLPRRIAAAGPYAEWDNATFYGGDARGYTDYPPLPA